MDARQGLQVRVTSLDMDLRHRLPRCNALAEAAEKTPAWPVDPEPAGTTSRSCSGRGSERMPGRGAGTAPGGAACNGDTGVPHRIFSGGDLADHAIADRHREIQNVPCAPKLARVRARKCGSQYRGRGPALN